LPKNKDYLQERSDLQKETRRLQFRFGVKGERFQLIYGENFARFKVKVIEKAIVINVKIRNERKRLYSSNKQNLTCLEKSITANL
jgi:hypothetical protein